MHLTHAQRGHVLTIALVTCLITDSAHAQLTDVTQAFDPTGTSIAKSLEQQIGAGRGNEDMPGSSRFIIRRDPFRSIRRGRQIFQRKFTSTQGIGPRIQDGIGSLRKTPTLGAGLSDSCSGCHARPRGSAGVGGAVFTHPDSRDAPHLFGIGIVEQIADEITADLRESATMLVEKSQDTGRPGGARLHSKGIDYGYLAVDGNGNLDFTGVRGVDEDLRVKPFFADGQFFSIRQVIVDAFQNEMGLQPVDSDLKLVSLGAKIVTPAGMIIDGTLDKVPAPFAESRDDDPDEDNVTNEIPAALVDHMEFYFLNYFRPATARQTTAERSGEIIFEQTGCTSCHIPDLVLDNDRRVADVITSYSSDEIGFNGLFAEVTPIFHETRGSNGFPSAKFPNRDSKIIRGIYSDFKRHNLGPNFHERNFDGSLSYFFMTRPLWGVGSTAPYGHDGRSATFRDVIMRHGGEAEFARKRFQRLSVSSEQMLYSFLNSLILFPPDDTASTLDKGDIVNQPQYNHGSIKLRALFNDPVENE